VSIAPIGAGHRAPAQRLLVVPTNLGGSVQHFYHFLFGYMLPFLEHCRGLRGTHRFLMRDCGPMNPLLGQLDGFAIDLVGLNLVLSSVVSANPADGALARLFPPGFDHPSAYRRARFARIRRMMSMLYGERIAVAGARWPQAASDRLVLVVDRAPPDPFYLDSRSESPGAGAARRSVPNIAELAAALVPHGEVVLVRLEDCDLFEQVHLFSRAWRVVAQHGAGLANMLWAPPGAALVEIMPNPRQLPPESLPNASYFRDLCGTLGNPWSPVTQAHEHAPVSPAAVEAALTALA
jgi:hypothetical protein